MSIESEYYAKDFTDQVIERVPLDNGYVVREVIRPDGERQFWLTRVGEPGGLWEREFPAHEELGQLPPWRIDQIERACRSDRCQGLTADGTRCRRFAKAGYCKSHKHQRDPK